MWNLSLNQEMISKEAYATSQPFDKINSKTISRKALTASSLSDILQKNFTNDPQNEATGSSCDHFVDQPKTSDRIINKTSVNSCSSTSSDRINTQSVCPVTNVKSDRHSSSVDTNVLPTLTVSNTVPSLVLKESSTFDTITISKGTNPLPSNEAQILSILRGEIPLLWTVMAF